MRISARADYAVRATVEIASHAPGLVKGEAVSEAQDIPIKFLEIILAELRRSGIVRSKRGAEGGYQLTKSADEVTLGDVIRAVDGPLAWVRDQRPGAVEYDGTAEPLRDVWIAVRASLRNVLDHVTVADVVAGRLPTAVTDLTSDTQAWED